MKCAWLIISNEPRRVPCRVGGNPLGMFCGRSVRRMPETAPGMAHASTVVCQAQAQAHTIRPTLIRVSAMHAV